MDSNNKDLVNKNLCQEQYKEIGIQVTVFQSDDGFRADVYIKFDEGYEVKYKKIYSGLSDANNKALATRNEACKSGIKKGKRYIDKYY
ncbi:MAG: hypothetical protein A3I88_02165 [Candidatus Portnoybacteria bacterium RIFCSPLOWO2_12_FULL_39_9]|uniref:Uncharacterized protein n=1 Tax=Candidatus Portnoybacteria bacterium RIFCSPHIGHO2_12_FULL_38_9 TaxID=1801997 RepID=A0A1G2FFV0_9BACT|nr:MAG: hypothetical protein A3H00_00955 [Candidatus Portnoybacteria bacterium RBG_13_40_8]OGZ36510.1 MAG: hypothetical protein A3J64_02700 [Candidatus Portnoybacteria bacterium RIFCSPHIGHO2_12_FULL_38_9]OGZ37077.1 MAG: hypothetical protein A2646_00680 [Candidatus Portnoybacteria bacterium RIFCSPHIGHO2_02_FULL_39_12]OGZ38215.1 MAG: hypothetical protein A3F21_01735 [Candidatus Portnoybacteria bacterium RIFCSPLOWO2_01_FULL_38_39]OGZ41302.1 MAG: hypothetical protein A3I88_02165 [Candidatus Portnoy